MVILHRERLLLHIDTWVYSETTDRRGDWPPRPGSGAGGRVATVRRTVTETVWNGCGSPATLPIAPNPEAEALTSARPDAKITSLSRASTIVSVPETASGSSRVHPNCGTRLPAMPAERTMSSCSGHEGGTR